jgi:predicted permease
MRLVVILALLALLAAGGVRVQALRTVAVKARRSSPRAFCGRGCVLRPNTPSHLRALPGFALEPAIVRSSVVALGELLSVVGLGIVAAKKNVLSAPNVTALSQIVYNVLLPCLLITSVAKTIVTQPARALLPIPLFAMAQIFTGLLVAGPVMRMVGLKRDTEAGREARVCAAFANSGVLPLVFCAALFQGHPDPTMLSRSMAYVSFFLMGWSPIFWTRGFSELVGKEKSGGGGLKRALGPPIVACAIGILVGVLKPIRYLLMGPDAPLSVRSSDLPHFG